MNDEMEIESTADDIDGPERLYYVDKIGIEELRRYVCLDLARMCEEMPKDVVKIAADMETFLLGNRLREVK